LNQLEETLTAGKMTLLSLESRDGFLPRERTLELSVNQILIIAVDGNSELRWWKLDIDPRLVRSEAVEANGQIRCENWYRPVTDFVVDCPDDPAIKELRFYHPTWTGKDFRLETLSTVQLR
jgi:hypothetical protein